MDLVPPERSGAAVVVASVLSAFGSVGRFAAKLPQKI